MSGVSFPVGTGIPFSFSYHSIKTSPGAHPASYPMDTGVSFPGGKWPDFEANHSPPCTVMIKNAWGYTSTLPTCLHGMVLS